MDHVIRYPNVGKLEIARLRILSYGIDYSRDLSIMLVSLPGADDIGEEYQLRCRRQYLRGDGRYWVRVIDRDRIRRALDALRGTLVPAFPSGFLIETGEITELDLMSGPGCRTSYSWHDRPPKGFEPLAHFATALQRWAGMREFPGHDGNLDLYLTEGALLGLAGRKIFARGSNYFESGFVTDLYVAGEALHATVRGTEIYPVRIWIEDDELRYSCGCPMGKRALCCKHVVAVGLAWEAEM